MWRRRPGGAVHHLPKPVPTAADLRDLLEDIEVEQHLGQRPRNDKEESVTYEKMDDIPGYVEGNYLVHVPLRYLENNLEEIRGDGTLDLDPDFQRGHVWTNEQRTAFIEHVLRKGQNTVIRFNCPRWQRAGQSEHSVLVDGKQRLNAALMFKRGEIPACGKLVHEYEDEIPISARLQFMMNDLETREEVLKWYLEINRGQVAHTPEELKRVEELLEEERIKNQ